VGQIVWIGFGVLLLLLAALAAGAHYYRSLSRASSVRLAEESVVRATLATDMERTLRGVRDNLTTFCLANQADAYDRGRRQLGDSELHVAAAAALSQRSPQNEVFAAAVRKLTAGLPAYRAEGEALHLLRGEIATSRENAGASFENLTRGRAWRKPGKPQRPPLLCTTMCKRSGRQWPPCMEAVPRRANRRPRR